MKTRIPTLLIHLFGSLAFLAIPFLVSPDSVLDGSFFRHAPPMADCINYALLLGFFYLNYYFILPKIYFKRRYWLFAVILILSFLLIGASPVLISRSITAAKAEKKMQLVKPRPNNEVKPIGPPEKNPMPNVEIGSRKNPRQPALLLQLTNSAFRFVLIVVLSLLLRISARLRQEKQEKSQAELAYLKAQINPHFLFNTLNGIYSLAILKSDATAPAIVKLSEMMRYVTTESQQEYVPLEKEMNYLRNYIDLQKMRVGETIDLVFRIEGEAQGKLIAPLLLIPFIENAFKYGVNPEEKSKIEIDLQIQSDSITLDVKNQKVKTNIHGQDGAGMGLENARKRFALSYPGKHTLHIHETASDFAVHLNVML
ncbi:MAG: sensor histidine kinase [Bacteroidia bacterium]